MRLVLYNIRYAVGGSRNFHRPIPGIGYLRRTHGNLDRMVRFLADLDPDVVGLCEVDMGSYRTSTGRNQAETIAEALGHDHVHECKYHEGSFQRWVPVLKKQGNAIITRHDIEHGNFHFFTHGVKRLIIELVTPEFRLYLVHLSLGFRTRQRQLRFLQDLVAKSDRPVLVAGDFNTFFGEAELYAFLNGSGLRSANLRGQPTHPSHKPRRELDFVFHDDRVELEQFFIPDVQFSDHLPLVCDFTFKS